MSELTIGQLAQRSGVAATTLRFYEKIGLLDAPRRSGGQRRYEEATLGTLEVIRMCKVAGFTLDEIVVLFADDAPGRPASRALATAKMAEIDRRIAELRTARKVLAWGMECTCPSIAACSCGIHPPTAVSSRSTRRAAASR